MQIKIRNIQYGSISSWLYWEWLRWKARRKRRIEPVIDTSGFPHRQYTLTLDDEEDNGYCFYLNFHGEIKSYDEEMLRYLIHKEIVSVWQDWSDSYKLKLMVNSSDVFVWGCSDSDEIQMEEIQTLFDLCWNFKHGECIWLCLKRKEKPQQPVEDMMKKDDSWIPELDLLEDNRYDSFCKKRFEENKKK